MSLKLNVGCNCCSTIPCCVCYPSFPSSLYTGDFDVTLSGFSNSISCDYCEFLNNTFTLECGGGMSGWCFNHPDDTDWTEAPCRWRIDFTEDAADRGCTLETVDSVTGLHLDSSIIWTNLILSRYKIDNGVDDPYPHWRLQIGYLMEVSVYEILLDPDGNPLKRGDFLQKCNDFYYDFPMSSSDFPGRCTLDNSDVFESTVPTAIEATYLGVTNVNNLCDEANFGSAEVEAALI